MFWGLSETFHQFFFRIIQKDRNRLNNGKWSTELPIYCNLISFKNALGVFSVNDVWNWPNKLPSFWQKINNLLFICFFLFVDNSFSKSSWKSKQHHFRIWINSQLLPIFCLKEEILGFEIDVDGFYQAFIKLYSSRQSPLKFRHFVKVFGKKSPCFVLIYQCWETAALD